MHDLIFFISWQLIIKLIGNKSLYFWYSFTFNVVITHEIITFKDICIDEIPKYFTSIKDTYYAALTFHLNFAYKLLLMGSIHKKVYYMELLTSSQVLTSMETV